MPRVLVTGANGFVGRTLCGVLTQYGFLVRGAYRNPEQTRIVVAEKITVGEITGTTDWAAALEGVTAVIHTAARAHVLGDSSANSELYMETNARGTRQLADAAVRAGVRRFIYVSSVKVNGEETTARGYGPDDEPQPKDAYGRSKWLGESYLHEVASRGSMETAIVRPPLVYGPGVRANFLRLMSWVDRGLPLPLGAIDNRRSLVSIQNLCDLLRHLVECHLVSGRKWMVSDNDDVSTPELIRRIGTAMNRRVRLVPVPTAALRILGNIVGRGAEVGRLCGSLTLDTTKTRTELGWTPPVKMDRALSETVSWYLSERQSLGR